jgi:hypothetical protein
MKQFKNKKNAINTNKDDIDESANKWYNINDITIYGVGLLLAAVGLYVSNIKVKKHDFKNSKDVQKNQLSNITTRREIKSEPLSRDTLQDISKLRELDELRIRYFPEYKKTLKKLLAPGKQLDDEDKKVEKFLQRLKDDEEDDQIPMYIYKKIMDQKNTGVHQESMEEMVLAYAHYTQEKISYHVYKTYNPKYFDPTKETPNNTLRDESRRRYVALFRKYGVEEQDPDRKAWFLPQ